MNATVLSVWKWNHRQERDMKNEMAHVQMHTYMFTSMKTEDCGQENMRNQQGEDQHWKQKVFPGEKASLVT